MQALAFHPWAELFPLLEGGAFEEFVADVKANGVREPVITYQGKILDGRNRYRACERLGIDPPQREYTGDSPLMYVISLNLHRRHLDESQRAMIAAKLANMSEGRPAANAKDSVSQSKAAEVMNVSRTSVTRARKVMKEAAPEVVKAVEAGAVRLNTAHEIAGAPRDEQASAAKEGPKAVRKLAKKRRVEKLEKSVSRAVTERNNAHLAAHARAEPKRRALYLWREFVALKVSPAEFVRTAGRDEAASLTRSVARFFLEVGRLAKVDAKKRTPLARVVKRAKASRTRKAKKAAHARIARRAKKVARIARRASSSSARLGA